MRAAERLVLRAPDRFLNAVLKLFDAVCLGSADCDTLRVSCPHAVRRARSS